MMYVRPPLSLRNVVDLPHERGIDICHETVRFWWHRFGPMVAAEVRKRRVEGMPWSRWPWHLDEVLESLVAKARSRRAALKFLKKSMKPHGRIAVIVADRLRPHGAALRGLLAG